MLKCPPSAENKPTDLSYTKVHDQNIAAAGSTVVSFLCFRSICLTLVFLLKDLAAVLVKMTRLYDILQDFLIVCSYNKNWAMARLSIASFYSSLFTYFAFMFKMISRSWSMPLIPPLFFLHSNNTHEQAQFPSLGRFHCQWSIVIEACEKSGGSYRKIRVEKTGKVMSEILTWPFSVMSILSDR